MRHKTAELTGALLDAAVALAEGMRPDLHAGRCVAAPDGSWMALFEPSTSWATGGSIIERERISLLHSDNQPSGYPWMALKGSASGHGLTAQVAAMRAYVASQYGETVELP